MNLHPLIVHFPVVLLSIYCILEVVTSFFYKNHENLLWLKKWSLWIGTLTLFPSLTSGDEAEHIVGKTPIVMLHEQFAESMRNLFVAISLIYVCNETILLSKIGTRTSYLTKFTGFLKKYYIVMILAIWGFAMMIGVGALGGAITRGVDHDPVANWIVEKVGLPELPSRRVK